EPQSLRHAGHEFGGRDRIPAGKQRDVMAERHQFLGQVGDDPFGAAVKPWGNAFDQRRDLRDFHSCYSFDKTPEPMLHQPERSTIVTDGSNGRARRLMLKSERYFTPKQREVARWNGGGNA